MKRKALDLFVILMIVIGVYCAYDGYLSYKTMKNTEYQTAKAIGEIVNKEYIEGYMRRTRVYYPNFRVKLEDGKEVLARVYSGTILDAGEFLEYINNTKVGDPCVVTVNTTFLYGKEESVQYSISIADQEN